MKYFTDTGLATDNKSAIVMGCLKRSQAKRLTDGAHNENIRHAIRITPLLAADKTSKEHFIRNAMCCCHTNELVALFAISGKQES
ncbi:hypothetical protein D3C86_2106330 [compost metagenome]